LEAKDDEIDPRDRPVFISMSLKMDIAGLLSCSHHPTNFSDEQGQSLGLAQSDRAQREVFLQELQQQTINPKLSANSIDLYNAKDQLPGFVTLDETTVSYDDTNIAS
jgi:hypothetical protein